MSDTHKLILVLPYKHGKPSCYSFFSLLVFIENKVIGSQMQQKHPFQKVLPVRETKYICLSSPAHEKGM